MNGAAGTRESRGMSNLVGIVLLVGLTLVGAVAVVVVGSAALGTVADQTEDDTTEDSMREMSARLAGVADSSVDGATSFQMEGDINASSATITIEVQNSTGGNESWTRSLGTIVSEQSDGSRLAYQGGGLWRESNGQTTLINEPGIDYDNTTLDLSIVNVSRFNSVSENGDVIARKNVSKSQAIQKDLADELSGVWTTSDGTVRVDMTVTIESQYADGWAEYARNGMTVSPAKTDLESENKVTMKFADLGAATGSGANNSTTPGGGAGGPGNGSEYDDALEYNESENALQVNQEVGNLTLMTAEIGQPVEVETVIDEEEYRDPMDVVFSIDETGSMENNDPSGERFTATENFIESLSSSRGDKTGLVQFTQRDECRNPFTCWGDPEDPEPDHEGTVAYHELTSNFDSVEDEMHSWESGGTNITRGIDKGIEVHTSATNPNEERVIVLLTDGENSDEYYNDASRDAAERAYNQHDITIYPVGLSDNADEELLQDIADLGGGEYFHADNADELDGIFDQIANETRTETIHQINRTHTTLRADQDGSSVVEADDDPNINDPNRFAENRSNMPAESQLTDLEPGGYLSFTLDLQRCEDYEMTDIQSKKTNNGTNYTHTLCEDEGSTTTINNTNADHMVFRNGDTANFSAITTEWWTSDPSEFLDEYADGGVFDLTAEESIIALDVEDADGQSGYVLIHFEVEEIEGDSDPGGESDDGVSGGDAPYQPITIGYSEVGVS